MQLEKSHSKIYVLPKLNDLFWAYLAGFIDGEGCIGKYLVRHTSVGNNFEYRLSIAQNRENGGKEIFEWFRANLGVGQIRFRKLNRTKKDVFYFEIRQRMALKLIFQKLLPFCHIKKQVIQEMLDDIEQVYGQVSTQG